MTRADEGEGREPGQIAYEARFADARPREMVPWAGQSDQVRAVWARVERASAARAEAEVARLRERVATLRAALKPFASITPSSFYSADGSEAEGYRAFLHEGRPRPEFTGADLARARTALEAPRDDGR